MAWKIQAVGLRMGVVLSGQTKLVPRCVAGYMADNLCGGLDSCLCRIGDMAGSLTGVAVCIEDNLAGGLGRCLSRIGDMAGRIGDVLLNRRRAVE